MLRYEEEALSYPLEAGHMHFDEKAFDDLAGASRMEDAIEIAVMIQKELASRVVTSNSVSLSTMRSVAGVDVGFRGNVARAAVVVLSFPDLVLLEEVLAEVPVSFPYVPGLLAFREGPAVLAALRQLTHSPDLMIFDSQGIAHPRRLGLASHMGVLVDHPSIGCAKSRLFGTYREPGPHKGDWSPMYDGAEVIGAAVRTRANCRPVFVSCGHKVDLLTAIECVLRCTTRYRLPEVTRLAHRAASSR